MSDLLASRPWLTLKEAAAYLTQKVGRPFKVAELYRLAIDGDIKLALNLPTGTTGHVRRFEDGETIAAASARIDGLWDLPLLGAARRQVESQYYEMMRLSYISMEGTKGAMVVRGDLICQLPPDPGRKGFNTRSPSAFPEGSVLVVKTLVLDEFAATLLPHTVVGSDDLDKPLEARERATLLTIIAVLCKRLKIDVSKPSSAAADIERLSEIMGMRVAARTVAEHLKKIRDALEKRNKS